MLDRRHIVLVVGLSLLGSVGCEPVPESRRLAVTLTDVSEIECTGATFSDAFEQEVMDDLARDIERAWEEGQAQSPPLPVGRTMHINETEERMRAWFDPHPDSEFAGDADAFASASVVYEGIPREDYIEGVHEAVFNTDAQDEEAGREECGDRVRMRGSLSATDAKGILGRIRWKHFVWVDSVTSSCAGRIDCVRDIAVEGLEFD